MFWDVGKPLLTDVALISNDFLEGPGLVAEQLDHEFSLGGPQVILRDQHEKSCQCAP